MRRVASLWLPRFATDRLARSRPQWRDRPLATVAEASSRLVVAAANAAAAARGIGPGMTLADARAIVPALETVPEAAPADARALARIAGWCGRYSPWTGLDSSAAESAVGGAAIWLDVSGCGHLFGGEAALLGDLTARLGATGYGARAAIADTPGAAWAAARFAPDDGSAWTVVAPGEAYAALAPLPVAALRLDAATVAALDALGLRRIGDLAAVARAALAARFGGGIADRLDRALGRAPEPLSPLPPAAPHFVRLAFPEPIGLDADLAGAVRRLAIELCAGLERAGRGARRLVLALYEPDGSFRRIRVGTGRPSRDPAHLARLFAERLDGVEAAFGIEAMTLAAALAERLAPAQAGFATDGANRLAQGVPAGEAPIRGTDELVDRLANRLGADNVVRFAARESHIPERAVRRRRALAAPPGAANTAGSAAWPANPRPLRLLARPEPIEATAPVPDDPPVMFRWRRVLYRIVRADGPERIAPEWWRDAAVRDGDALRDYYRVEDAAGRRFWVFREGLYSADAPPAWFVHGTFG